MPAKRYEVLLPTKYNDGRAVEDREFQQSWTEILDEFGAITIDIQPMAGKWTHQGMLYEDELVRFVVDVEDTPRAREFFREWKETLKQRFDQLDVWIVGMPIDII